MTILSRNGLVCRTLWLAVAAAITLRAASAPNPDEIVRKSVDAIRADWAEAPKYSYVERDVEKKKHTTTQKTYRVLMIDGSPYNFVIAIDGQHLAAPEKAAEQRKLQREINRRHNESARERDKRIAKYQKEQDRDHQMLREMVSAFQFRLAGEAQVEGHDCWILDASPKPGYEPDDHEGRVLKGMQGRLWIDKAT